MAQLLLDTLAGDYDPGEFEDDYAEAVHELVQAKLEGGEVKRQPEAPPATGEVVDLLAALQKSVAAAKEARGEDTSEPSAGDETSEKPAKKSTAKKSAKKTAARKST